MESSSYQHVLKFIIVGNSNVGKSCLIRRYITNDFVKNYDFTIGVEYNSKIVVVGDQRIKLNIWDTAGQERFRSITRSFYRNAQCIVLMYCIDDRQSFDDLSHWFSDIMEANYTGTCSIMLVGNKLDMDSVRVVGMDEGEIIAKKYGIPFVELSCKTSLEATSGKTLSEAKTSTSVDAIFLQLIEMSIGKMPASESLIEVIAENSAIYNCCVIS